MIQATTVGPVQPHVCGGAMVVVPDGPSGHSDTRPFISPVFLSYIKLRYGDIKHTVLEHGPCKGHQWLYFALVPSRWSIQMWWQWWPNRTLSPPIHEIAHFHSPENNRSVYVGQKRNHQWEYIHLHFPCPGRHRSAYKKSKIHGHEYKFVKCVWWTDRD